MLVRAYRLTDRLGLAVLKMSAATGQFLLENLAALRRAGQGATGGLLGVLLAILMSIFAGVRWLFGRFLALTGTIGGTAASATGRTVQGAGGAMARRASRAEARNEIDREVAEDPLKRQNRLLSALIVVVLGTLIVIVVWATSNQGGQSTFTPSSDVLNAAAEATNPPAAEEEPAIGLSLPTAVPTATELPAVLQARGSIAYVVRERGQTDIWAAPVDGGDPLRVTNSPSDERDPAFSPDGTQIAYASNKEGNWDIYLLDLATQEETRMTFGLSFEGAPRWSPTSEYLVYESYQDDTHLDIFLLRTDGAPIGVPRVPGSTPSADLSPAWSSDGSQIAFASWQNGSKDIFVFTIADSSVYNLTNTPGRDEDYPAWSPDSSEIAFSAIENGREFIYVQNADENSTTAQVFRQGSTPTWSPDGNSIAFTTQTSTNTLITVAPYGDSGAVTEVIAAPQGTSRPDWTATPLPAQLVNSGGLPLGIEAPLFIEQAGPGAGDPPYRLQPMLNVEGPEEALLSERVDDSFNALRIAANEAIGRDFLGRLSDAFWEINYRPPLGVPADNWHKTGRAFSFNRNLIVGFPPPIEIVREDTDLATYWRIYVRVPDDAQSGQLGEPLRQIPWSFERDTAQEFERGGTLREAIPEGYYVDLTRLAANYGWSRVASGNDWRDNFETRYYWTFQKRDDLNWYEAMREIYTEGQLGGFNPTPTTDTDDPTTELSAPTVAPTAETEIEPAPEAEVTDEQ
jgi:TolB protein